MRETIKDVFRREHGYDFNHRCRECARITAYSAGKKTVYKCPVLGITGGSATDVKLKDIACNEFIGGSDYGDDAL